MKSGFASSCERSSDRILVVEDEPMVAEVVERYLRREGYVVSVVCDGALALRQVTEFRPSLIVLDLMLPKVDGIEVCRHIRSSDDTPIIMLTARGDEQDRLDGLDIGADDYMTKPFSPRELVARVKAVLRRASRQTNGDGVVIQHGDISINPETRRVKTLHGDSSLTAREFDLLYFLASHPDQVFSREQLLEAVWDLAFPGDDSTVTVHMRRLRTKIEINPTRPRHLKTVWGVGYKFEA